MSESIKILALETGRKGAGNVNRDTWMPKESSNIKTRKNGPVTSTRVKNL